MQFLLLCTLFGASLARSPIPQEGGYPLRRDDSFERDFDNNYNGRDAQSNAGFGQGRFNSFGSDRDSNEYSDSRGSNGVRAAFPVNFINDFNSAQRPGGSNSQFNGYGNNQNGQQQSGYQREFNGGRGINGLDNGRPSGRYGNNQDQQQTNFGQAGINGGGFASSGNGGYGNGANGGSNCQDPLVAGPDGNCVEPKVIRNLYIYKEPRSQRNEYEGPLDLPQPKVKVNLVVINSASGENGDEPIVIPPPQEKTLVLVLDKDENGDQQVIELPENPSIEPEVFFVKYKEGENPELPGGIDLETALLGTDSLEEEGFPNDRYSQPSRNGINGNSQPGNQYEIPSENNGAYQQQQGGNQQQYGPQQQAGIGGRNSQSSQFSSRDGNTYPTSSNNQIPQQGNFNGGVQRNGFAAGRPQLGVENVYSSPSNNQDSAIFRQSPSIVRGNLRSFYPNNDDSEENNGGRTSYGPQQPTHWQQQSQNRGY